MLEGLPEWMAPPRAGGWEADDLDRLPQAPRHTELVDGALLFRLWPQRAWHSRLVKKLAHELERAGGGRFEVAGGAPISFVKGRVG
ncbi:hypothetical protein [Streptomyces niveiscabiei]|uniref:hypothetical protein n=1 Tax=Streptomyces niveiscabiei TaxID=164115 RepID=UPI00389A8BC0